MRLVPSLLVLVLVLGIVGSCGQSTPTPPAGPAREEPRSPTVAPPPAAMDRRRVVPSAPQLAVTGLEPERGDVEGGTYVRITGRRFVADGPRNAKVYFGSRQGTVVRFASDSELIVEAPGGHPNETVDVLIVFEPGGQLKIKDGFTFVEAANP